VASNGENSNNYTGILTVVLRQGYYAERDVMLEKPFVDSKGGIYDQSKSSSLWTRS